MSKPSQIFQKEAQATIAFVILDSLYHENKTTSKTLLAAKMDDAFHGNRGQASQIDIFRSGGTIYKSLFIEDGNASKDGPTDFALIVPPILTRNPSVVVNVDNTMPKPVLESTILKGGHKITGRTIQNLAGEALKNCKKALAFALEFLDEKRNPPSGKNVDDYVKFVLQKMYASTMASSKSISVENLEEFDDDDTSAPVVGPNASGDPAENWFFRGFWAFYLLGPYPFKENSTTLMELGDITCTYRDKTLVGRAHARKKQRQDSGFAQSAEDTYSKAKQSSPWKRGVCMKDRLGVTHISQQEQMIVQRQHECNVICLGKALKAQENLMKSAERIFRHTSDPDHLQEYIIAKKEYAALAAKMKEMESPALQVAAAPNAMVAQLVTSTFRNDVACMPNFPGGPSNGAGPLESHVFQTPSVISVVRNMGATSALHSSSHNSAASIRHSMSMREEADQVAAEMESDDETNELFNFQGIRDKHGV